jgi:hypothetical protein
LICLFPFNQRHLSSSSIAISFLRLFLCLEPSFCQFKRISEHEVISFSCCQGFAKSLKRHSELQHHLQHVQEEGVQRSSSVIASSEVQSARAHAHPAAADIPNPASAASASSAASAATAGASDTTTAAADIQTSASATHLSALATVEALTKPELVQATTAALSATALVLISASSPCLESKPASIPVTIHEKNLATAHESNPASHSILPAVSHESTPASTQYSTYEAASASMQSSVSIEPQPMMTTSTSTTVVAVAEDYLTVPILAFEESAGYTIDPNWINARGDAALRAQFGFGLLTLLSLIRVVIFKV